MRGQNQVKGMFTAIKKRKTHTQTVKLGTKK